MIHIIIRLMRHRDNAVAALDKLHAKHVLPGFADRSAEERDIESLSSDITRVCCQTVDPAFYIPFKPH